MKKTLISLSFVFCASTLSAQNANCSPTFSEIFDFEVGDKFHYSLITTQDDHDGTTAYFIKETITITDKIVSGDTTFYHREITNRNGANNDTLVLLNDGSHTLHACDSDFVKVSDYLHPSFTSNTLDTTDIYALVKIYNNDTVRSWRNDKPRIVKAINADRYDNGFYLKSDSNTYEPFMDICESLILEYAEGAGLIFEGHFCFESGYYRVLLSKTNGNDTTIYSTASIDNEKLKPLDVTAFPNPVVDRLTLKYEKSETTNYTITNAQGQIVAEGQSQGKEQAIDVSHLPAGLYILTSETSDASGSVRFIKE